MKYSAFLATCGAALAAASPILQDRRLYIKTDIVVEWITVTVTEGQVATVFNRPNGRPRVKATTTTVAAPSSTSAPPPPPPPPSSTSIAEPVVQPSPEPSPEPAPSPSPEPQPQPQPQPVVNAPAPSADPAPATPSQVETTQPSGYSGTALHHHNVHRANHSASDLVWDDGIASSAKVLAERCEFKHDV